MHTAMLQTGTGHFSPIGGYHAGRDMALILDVARFKYPPHWVPIPLLWEAMNTFDEATGLPRGYVIIFILLDEKSSNNKCLFQMLLCLVLCKFEVSLLFRETSSAVTVHLVGSRFESRLEARCHEGFLISVLIST